MSTGNYITSFCSVDADKIVLNHEKVFGNPNHEIGTVFFKAAYKNLNIDYQKFYKMDALCKLAFIGSEYLLKTARLNDKYPGEQTAIVVSNRSSSLESDVEHQKSIKDPHNFFPSPAVFVYTLPNILIGEIAIRNSIKGENSLFIFEHFNAGFIQQYTDILLARPDTQACISGYIDYFEDRYRAFLYTVEKEKGILELEHNEKNLTQLYNI